MRVDLPYIRQGFTSLTVCEKCAYWDVVWSLFSRIRNEYGEIRSFLWKYLSALNHWLFSQKVAFYMSDMVLNTSLLMMSYDPREQSKTENYQRNSTKTPNSYLIWQWFPCLKNQEIFDSYFKQMRISSLCDVCAFPKNLHTTRWFTHH